MPSIQEELIKTIRDVPDFPKPGILFKDITPILADAKLSVRVSEALAEQWEALQLTSVIGIESRGFIFGMQLAQTLGVAFIPVRKVGKLPYKTIKHSYDLEYGSAEIEMHMDAVKPGDKVLIHDDLLATGGTAAAAAELVKKSGGEVGGFSFLIELAFLKGIEKLKPYHHDVRRLVSF
ncbi:MAG: adenine phosphoribosyltransferase [Cyclobacteriaceae bacterium]|nr:adenine phosphoribosyltransferase [Cyclobacteriaceae bacterium HetDA_MAG_MS6]